MAEEEPIRVLTAAAIAFVSYRIRTEKEIRDFLHKKIVRMKLADTSLADGVISRLRELRYVDDDAFARAWVESRLRAKPRSANLLLRELLRKGVGRQLAQSTIDACMRNTGGSERDLAASSLRKKIPHWSRFPLADFRKKAFGYLLRRGFSGSVASGVIDAEAQKIYNSSQAGTDSSEYEL